MEHGKLTPKQRRFIEAYIIDLNATQAAIRAGYSGKTAKSQGQRLLTNADVADAIAAAMNECADKNKLDAQRVLQELACLAFCDVGNAFNPDGTMKPIHGIDEDTRRAIVGFDVIAMEENGAFVGTLKKVKFADKLRALELLGKHLGLFTDVLKVKGEAENPIRLMIEAVQGNVLRPVPQGAVTPTTIDYDFTH